MARTVPSGTPTRSKRYLTPLSGAGRWALAAGVGAVVLTGLIGLYFIGAPRFVSPGDVAAEHAPIDLQCAQCHQPAHGVTALRCERCHDVGGTERLAHAAHVLLGSADEVKADRASTLACVQCHTDHRGRASVLRAVDDRECGQCHEFGALDRHPEFAVVNAAITTGLGLKFDHDRHVIEVVSGGLERCQSCHVPTIDQAAFEPIDFDDHCQACHVDAEGFVTGRTDPLAPEYVLAPDEVPEPWAAESEIAITPAARGRSEFGKMRHRDRWTLYNARRLRRAIDPEGEAAEREALRGQVAYLEQQLALEPLTAAGTANLDAWAVALEAEVATLTAGLGDDSEPAPAATAAALTRMTADVQAVAQALADAEPSVRLDAEALASIELAIAETDLAQPDDPSGTAPPDFEARRTELLNLLDAISERGDDRLAERAADLRDLVTGLAPGETGGGDTAAYRDGLQTLDEIVRTVRDVPDAEAQYDAAQLAVLRTFAGQQVTGGLTVGEFSERRRQLLSLLTAIEQTGPVGLRARAAPLRQRILAARPGADGDRAVERLLRRRRKDLARVRLELEFAAAGEPAPLRTAAPVRDRQAVQAELEASRARLADLEGGSRPGEASNDDRSRLGIALESLLVPCLKCHELSGPKLAPVTVAEPVMPRALFDHAPHVIQTECATCHASVDTSELATDVNVPDVASCRACHRPGEARADCAGCHVYHPPSVAALVGNF